MIIIRLLFQVTLTIISGKIPSYLRLFPDLAIPSYKPFIGGKFT